MTIMHAKKFGKLSLLLCAFLLVLFTRTAVTHGAEGDSKSALMPKIGDALVEVRAEDYSSLKQSLLAFREDWENTEKIPDMADTADQISTELDTALQMLKNSSINQDALYEHIVNLARATDQYVSSSSGADTKVDRVAISRLIQYLADIQTQIKQGHMDQARAMNQTFVSKWTALEKPIRETNLQAYGSIETKMSMVRVSLNKSPLDKQQAIGAIDKLKQDIQNYLKGKISTTNTPPQENVTVQSLIKLLNRTQTEVNEKEYQSAADQIQKFIQSWPLVEGEVLTKSKKVYTQSENSMTEVLTIVSSDHPDKDKALRLLKDMKADLEPFANQSNYSAWDAFFILFREGMEAILVIATLLAYLRRTGNEDKQRWVWSGLGAGVVLSAGLAILLTVLFAGFQAGTNREMIEGFTGLIAVVMMITVGAWLHKQSNVLAWNQYVNHQLQKVMKKGGKWLLALVTFIAIFREGAETILFYLGMAPSIKLTQLLMGMGGALLLLIVIGVLLIKLSVRIPIRPFFLAASLMIYYVAFKFTGVSIHALQITDILPVHPLGFIPTIDLLGIYPTFETSITQLLLGVIILAQFMNTGRRKRKYASSKAS